MQNLQPLLNKQLVNGVTTFQLETEKSFTNGLLIFAWLQLHPTFGVSVSVTVGFGFTLRASFRLLRVVVSRSWCYKNLHGRPWAQSDTSGIFGEIACKEIQGGVSFGNPLLKIGYIEKTMVWSIVGHWNWRTYTSLKVGWCFYHFSRIMHLDFPNMWLARMRKNPKCLLPTCCCTSLGTSKTQYQTFETLEHLQTKNTMELFWLNFLLRLVQLPAIWNIQITKSSDPLSRWACSWLTYKLTKRHIPNHMKKNRNWFLVQHFAC